MTALTEAAVQLRYFVADAGIIKMPIVRLTFNDCADMERFKLAVIKNMQGSDLVTTEFQQSIAANTFEVEGFTFKVAHVDASAFDDYEGTLTYARAAMDEVDKSPQLRVETIAKMRTALRALLKLMKA